MQNMNVAIKGSKMIIEIDLTQEAGVVEKTGNAKIAATDFWEKPPGMEGHSLNLTLIRKKGVEPFKPASRKDRKEAVEQQTLV